MSFSGFRLGTTALLLATLTTSVCASDFKYKLESKLNYRDSAENRFPTAFPFPPSFLPVGQTSAFLETVDAGGNFEVSAVSLSGIWSPSEPWSIHFKTDAIDKYDRNPTSEDRKFDIDHLFLRYSGELPGIPGADNSGYYLQAGKFEKFERQQERRTESYGLISTAFNRFEDSGIEAGLSTGSGFYGKVSYTTGNPVFIRDPNALAGDNGTDDRRVPPENPDPSLKSGIVLLYDAEIEDFNLGSNPEIGAALGYQWQTADASHLVDVMAFGYHRNMAENVSLHGTFYGADLDLLDLGDVPGASSIRLPVSGNDKDEFGANLKYQWNNLALFAQYVDQDSAGLERDGFEIELSYVFDLPVVVTPIIRYSELNNNFIGDFRYPAPSVWWDWKKTDYGLNFKINPNVDVIVEYTDNRFLRSGKWENNNELLVTVRLALGNSQ